MKFYARKTVENKRFYGLKYPLDIFLQNIALLYCQVSTHKVAKIQLLGTKIHYTKF